MTYKKIASLVLLLAGLAGFAVGQTALTQTTLAAAVSGPAFYNGNSPTIQTTISLASTTGLSAPILPGTPSSILYVGREAMGVFSVNTTTNTVLVNRGYLGTQATPHPSGDMVLYGPNYAVTLSQGGNPLPSGLFQFDPPQGAACTAGNTPTTPWVNVLTGAQWLCSTITNTWIPGFNNPLVASAPVANTAVASAATILPTGPLFHLTGTTTVNTITTPVGCNATSAGGCQFTAICDGVCVWSAAGNILTASGTMVAGTQVTFTWNAATSKWIPNVTT